MRAAGTVSKGRIVDLKPDSKIGPPVIAASRFRIPNID
jgi:hypothetical protein